MVYTSYFAAMRKMSDDQSSMCVCVSLWKPQGIQMPVYRALMPTKDIILSYKQNQDINKFTNDYYAKVLHQLNPDDVYRDLDNKILVCYEKTGDFCHRHIIASWLKHYGFACEELKA